MITTLDILFFITNSLFLIASYPMMRAALKNKDSLIGFSFTGAICTFMGMWMSISILIYTKSYFNILLALPTLAYWGIVTYYSRK